jgi:GxxExxY protein
VCCLADMLLEALSREIIGAALEVHRTLGPGFVEAIYKSALCRELDLRGLSVESEREVVITYKNHMVGRHRLDLVVESQVIVELKAASAIADVHLAQALSYMTATGMELTLIVNFGRPSLAWKRLVKTQK